MSPSNNRPQSLHRGVKLPHDALSAVVVFLPYPERQRLVMANRQLAAASLRSVSHQLGKFFALSRSEHPSHWDDAIYARFIGRLYNAARAAIPLHLEAERRSLADHCFRLRVTVIDEWKRDSDAADLHSPQCSNHPSEQREGKEGPSTKKGSGCKETPLELWARLHFHLHNLRYHESVGTLALQMKAEVEWDRLQEWYEREIDWIRSLYRV